MIAHEVIKHLRDQNVSVGPGRGAVCDSFIAYLLGIVELNPMDFQIGCERFFGTRNQAVFIDIAPEGHSGVRRFLRSMYQENCRIVPNTRLWDPQEVNAEDEISIALPGNATAELVVQSLNVLKRVPFWQTEIPWCDADTFAFLSSGKADGVFELKDTRVQEICRKWQVCNLPELATCLSLRQSNFEYDIDTLLARRRNQCGYTDIPVLNPYLSESSGIILYQEQLIRILREVAGFHAFEANDLRKALNKHRLEEAEQFQKRFMLGCRNNGLDTATAEAIWNKIYKFPAHAILHGSALAYAALTYRSAYYILHEGKI